MRDRNITAISTQFCSTGPNRQSEVLVQSALDNQSRKVAITTPTTIVILSYTQPKIYISFQAFKDLLFICGLSSYTKEGRKMHTRLAELKPSYRIIHFIYSDQNTILATIEKITVLTEIK
jgi:hypothetical protein